MTNQQTPEPEDGDDIPPVKFSLRNVTGQAGELELHQHWLGTSLYILIQPGDDGPTLEASHLSLDDLACTLGFVLTALLQSDEVSDEVRENVRDLVAEEADRG